MSKTIDSLVQTSIDSKNFAGIVLCKAEFETTLRVNNTNQTVYWDEAGGGELAYLGVGKLANISVLPETTELGAVTIQLSLSGIPPEHITDAFSDTYRNKPIYLWYATLNPSTYAIEGGQTGPVLIFAGLMDNAVIEFGKECTVTINSTSRLADWERPRGGRFNQSYQQQYVDPTDTGFRYVMALQDIALNWGGYPLAGGSSTDTGGREPDWDNDRHETR